MTEEVSTRSVYPYERDYPDIFKSYWTLNKTTSQFPNPVN